MRSTAEATSAGSRRLGGAVRRSPRRLRSQLLTILQTAAAAVAAYYLAELLLSDERPAFASIAAVVCLSATLGRRRQQALQFVGGVVVGITVADLIVQVIGSGPPQIGVMVLLAMSAAVLLGGGELLVAEAAVSAILLVVLAPGDVSGFSPNRIVQAVIGGGVALTVAMFFFPPDPRLMVDRAVQAVFGELGHTLQRVGRGLAGTDAAVAQRAVDGSEKVEGLIDEVEEALLIARETARFAPPRRGARDQLEPYARSIAQIDFAARNTRVLARHAQRYVRHPTAPPGGLADAVSALAEAVWALAASYEEPERTDEVSRLCRIAAARATAVLEGERDLALTEMIAQVRSVAVDLLRAAELVTGIQEADERPTQELLAEPKPG
jgi:uncharacterized membrane protein YccC